MGICRGLHAWVTPRAPSPGVPVPWGTLTEVLQGEASVCGHVDEEHHLPRVLPKGDILVPIDGQGPIVVDGALHRAVAFHLWGKEHPVGSGWGLPATPFTHPMAACTHQSSGVQPWLRWQLPALCLLPRMPLAAARLWHAKIRAAGWAGVCMHMHRHMHTHVHTCACPASGAGCSWRDVYPARVRQEGERLENSLSWAGESSPGLSGAAGRQKPLSLGGRGSQSTLEQHRLLRRG